MPNHAPEGPARTEPLGVTLVDGGVGVAVVSSEAERIDFCLFDADGTETARIPLPDRLGDVHSGFVPGVVEGQRYGLRAHGPWRPEEGLRFNPAKLLVDPYATRLATPYDPGSAMAAGREGLDDLILDPVDTAPLIPKALVEPARAITTSVPVRPSGTRIIYELHVKGFTALHPDVPPDQRGTFAGLGHPAVIRHLVDLGITTVEIMPASAWVDERHLPGLGLSNYWGYNALAFLAPDPRLAPGGMAEVAACVAALHEAGLEVILDVVFNHTGESDERGQTLSLRGLDNRLYYRLADNPRFYVNDTGCGHTLALDRPAVVRLATDALRHWALQGGIDGFRFDLAPALCRVDGRFDTRSPFLAAIEQDPVLRDRPMIAEPWDIGPDGYRLGAFPARWSEWSDRYRDDVRRFWRGDGGVGALATRLAGSSDIFGHRHRRPSASVNFLSAHDGFTLADVVAYSGKHNEANGEGNRDGHSGEIAWNHGEEGPSGNEGVAAARRADVRALLATLMVSRGTAMITMGDEIGRSQGGNNNAYAQDNETTWLDWGSADRDLATFTARLITLRRDTPALSADRFLTGAAGIDGLPDIAWITPEGGPMQEADWAGASVRTLGMMLAEHPAGRASDSRAQPRSRLLVWIHAGHEAARAMMPEPRRASRWRVLLASAPMPDSFEAYDRAELPPRSVTILAEEAVAGDAPAAGRDRTVAPELLDRIASLAGIAPEWWEVSGRHTIVSPDTKRALLASMGLPAATPGQARDSLGRLLEIAELPREASPAAACFMPDALAAGGRRYGLAAQLYTVRREGDQAVGDFTTLRRLADLAAARGAATVAVNPLHALFASNRGRSSPYQPSDRRFLDPVYIDLSSVPEIDAAGAVLADSAGDLAALSALRLVDWPAVWRLKRAALAACHAALRDRPARRRAVDSFRKRGGPALEGFATFQALEEETGGTAAGFPKDWASRIAGLGDAIDFAVYLQFLAEEQLAAAAGSALEIGLYRDIAVGAAPDGAEVWSAPDAFLKGVTVGSPPDPFSAAGQIWNIPPLDPVRLQTSDYAHFRDLLRANMRHAGALRIDHAMALTRLFVIPDGAAASEGAYVAYPLEGMVRALGEESRRARCLVIGEDLGTVPEGFRDRMERADILSYRVLFFERDGPSFRPPSAYPAKAVACVATHDLPTLKGWWSGADLALEQVLGRAVAEDASKLRAEDRATLAGLVGQSPDELTPELTADIHSYLASSPACLVLAQLEDLAGEIEPVNVPGTEMEYPNWRRRIDGDVDHLLEGRTATLVTDRMKQAGR